MYMWVYLLTIIYCVNAQFNPFPGLPYSPGPASAFLASSQLPSSQLPSSQLGSTLLYRNEIINSAQYVTRPVDNRPYDHHGVQVQTNLGNDYLIHNMPKTGVVVTDASHMSSNWNVKNEINVNGIKTIGETLDKGSGIGNGLLNYVTSPTCIGTANRVESYLEKK